MEGDFRTLCDGHADLLIAGHGQIDVHELYSTGRASARRKILIGIAWQSGRDCWLVRHEGREEEIDAGQTHWLGGWMQGTTEEADLYSISINDVADMHRLLTAAGLKSGMTIGDARTILFHAIRQTRLDEAQLRRLYQEVADANHEVRATAFLRLTELFDSYVAD